MNPPEKDGRRWLLTLSPDGAARTVSMNCARSFGELPGTVCKTFDSLTYRNAFDAIQKNPDNDMTVDLLNQSLVVSCLDFNATHLLVTALSPITVFTLNLLRKHRVKTVHWFYEDFRRAAYWKDVVAGYDHFCAIQRGPLPEACKAAGAEFHFLPTAASPVPFSAPPSENRPYDVVFIGIPSPYRIAVLEQLFLNGLRLAIGGSGWSSYRGALQKSIVNTAWMDERESFELMCKARTGLNLSVDVPVDRELVHISPRVYDIVSAGCVLVSENVPLLSESLPGIEYASFYSQNDAPEVVRKAIAAYGGAEDTIRKNREMVMQNHSYAQRINQLIAFS